MASSDLGGVHVRSDNARLVSPQNPDQVVCDLIASSHPTEAAIDSDVATSKSGPVPSIPIGRREALILKACGNKEAIKNWKFVSKSAGNVKQRPDDGSWLIEATGMNPLGYRRMKINGIPHSHGPLVPWELLRSGEHRVLADGDEIGLLGKVMRLRFSKDEASPQASATTTLKSKPIPKSTRRIDLMEENHNSAGRKIDTCPPRKKAGGTPKRMRQRSLMAFMSNTSSTSTSQLELPEDAKEKPSSAKRRAGEKSPYMARKKSDQKGESRIVGKPTSSSTSENFDYGNRKFNFNLEQPNLSLTLQPSLPQSLGDEDDDDGDAKDAVVQKSQIGKLDKSGSTQNKGMGRGGNEEDNEEKEEEDDESLTLEPSLPPSFPISQSSSFSSLPTLLETRRKVEVMENSTRATGSVQYSNDSSNTTKEKAEDAAVAASNNRASSSTKTLSSLLSRKRSFSHHHLLQGQPSLGGCSSSKKARSKFFEPRRRLKCEKKEKGASGTSVPTKSILKLASWNANGFGTRLINQQDRSAFVSFLRREDPDVICIQEVNLPAEGPPGCKRNDGRPRKRNRIGTQTKKAFEDAKKIAAALRDPMLSRYNFHWSLSDWKYAGTAMMIRKGLHVSKIKHRFPGEGRGGHDPDGRICIATVEGIEIWSTYVPNSGWTTHSHSRRETWDKRVLEALKTRTATGMESISSRNSSSSSSSTHPPLIWAGDLNVCREDRDASHIRFFRETIYSIQRHHQKPATYRNTGQPGVIPHEQERFREMLRVGNLLDAYRVLHPKVDRFKDFTWRGSPPAIGSLKRALYYDKGMRIDYTLVSSAMKEMILRAETCGRGKDREGFLGSDHCPIILHLKLQHC